MRWILAGAIVGLTAVLLGLAVLVSGASDRPSRGGAYDQSTPDAVLISALQMVEDGEVGRLTELIHADSDEMRAVLNRVGSLLQRLHVLADEIQTRFPDEVAEMRAKAESAAGANGGMQSLFAGAPQRQRGGRGGPPWSTAGGGGFLQPLLADPFAWIERNRTRMTVIQTADNTAAIMVDGKPAFGLGLTMRLEDDRWQVMLPLRLPFISRYMPQTREEWAIVASLVEVIDRAVDELAADVRAGRCRNIEAVAELAGEKAWMPVVMCVMAYNRAMEARERSPGSSASPRGGEPSMRGMRF
ncbi:MAG: hypothetical protein EA376_07415 [Phycisphaeraceae bacterium]|nr:MAG: hypothetical protein EA376_07415 [Phycisphaeraceae bacterium]